MKKAKKEKGKKKPIIISIVIIFIIILLALTTLVILSKIKPEKKEKEKLPEWGQKYYTYLKEFPTNSKKLLKENNVDLKKEYQGTLYNYLENKEEPPLLSLEPGVKDNYLVVVLLIDGKPKDFVIKEDNAEIELLYNVQEEEYYYYFIYEKDNQTHFIKLVDYINYLLDNNKKYEETVITTGEKITVNGEDLLKVDTLFIEPNKAKLQFNYKPEEIEGLEDEFRYYIKDVKKSDKLLADDTKNGINEKKEKVKTILIEIEKQKKDEPTPQPTPPKDPEDPSITDPNNCTGWNKDYAPNPCLCETFTGCINDLFEHEVCGIGHCSSKQSMTKEECDQYGGELSGETCWTPYK